jgi:predicted acetyltransferase
MIELKRPSMDLMDSYLDSVDEMTKLGEEVWEGYVPGVSERPEDFLARLRRNESAPPSDLVPESTYWAVIGPKVVGRISLRHRLNEALCVYGGHIGYEVRPSVRRQGIASEMLRLLLQTPKAGEIGRILLTCSPTNKGSNRTIAANGGILEKTIWVEKIKRDTNLYWITLPGPGH